MLNVVNRIIFSSILQIWFVEVRISRSISESPLEFEITRVDCIVEIVYNTSKHSSNLRNLFSVQCLTQNNIHIITDGSHFFVGIMKNAWKIILSTFHV